MTACATFPDCCWETVCFMCAHTAASLFIYVTVELFNSHFTAALLTVSRTYFTRAVAQSFAFIDSELLFMQKYKECVLQLQTWNVFVFSIVSQLQLSWQNIAFWVIPGAVVYIYIYHLRRSPTRGGRLYNFSRQSPLNILTLRPLLDVAAAVNRVLVAYLFSFIFSNRGPTWMCCCCCFRCVTQGCYF